MKEFHYQDCFMRYDGSRLTVGNEKIVREMDFSLGLPRTVSLKDAAGREYASPEKELPDFSFIGLNGPDFAGIVYETTEVEAAAVEQDRFDSPHLLVSVVMREPVQNLVFRRFFAVYPGQPAIAVWNSLRTAVMPNVFWSQRSYEFNWNLGRMPESRMESCVDGLRLADSVKPRKTVEFRARTDVHEDLVFEHEIVSSRLRGNLFYASGDDGAGLLYLQEAPPSQERRDWESHDFRLDGTTVFSCCWGVHPSEIVPDREFVSCRNVVALYSSEKDASPVLKKYLRTRFRLSEKHCSVTVNPWGCGRFPALVSEEFLMAELKAAGEVGATHYQIDDSWQEGGSLSEMINRNRHIRPSFWAVSRERLGGSFRKLVECAKEAGVEPSLWVAPSSNAEYRDWRSFCDMLLNYHREYGFNIFKIDGVLIRTSEAERNLETLLRTAREESGGEIFFNLDTTAGQRPGYFRMLEYGNIFLENRYVCHLWGCGYHPEKTLRALWKLSKYMRPQMLQIEIPYIGDINREFYRTKKEGSPDAYPWKYWMAVAMFANPLLWFAPSLTTPEERAEVREMMEIHREVQKKLFAGDIHPIGEEPSGKDMTGFYSTSGFLIVYREKACRYSSMDLEIPAGDWKLIAGEGRCTNLDGGHLEVALPRQAGFAMFRNMA